jgi:putative MATE family efflux protein
LSRKNNHPLLTEGPIARTLVKLSSQMLVGIFGMVAFSLVDTYFVGQLGKAQLAAMGYVVPVAMVIMGLAFGIGTGTATVVARAIGQGDFARVRRLTTDALTLSLVTVAILIIIGLATMDSIFRLLGAGPDTLPLIKEYMTIWYGGMLFLVVPMVGNSAIRATGDARTPATIMTAAFLVNLVLDPFLIFGLGPFPRLELAGAALATVIARATTLVVALHALHWKHKLLTAIRPSWKEGLASWRAVLYVGLPNAATNIVLPLGSGIITRLASGYGDAAVAALGVAGRIDMFAMTPVMALGAIMGPFVGQNWGARKWRRLHQGIWGGLRFCAVWGTAMAVVLALFGRPLAGLFSRDPVVVDYLVLYLALVPLGYGLRSTVNLTKMIMNSLNRPIPGSIITLVQMFLLYVPLAWAGSLFFGMAGLFFAGTLAGFVAGTCGWFWLRRMLKEMDVRGGPSPGQMSGEPIGEPHAL